MSLQRRLTAFTLTVVVLTSGSVGLFLIEMGFQNQVEQVKEEINAIAAAIGDSEVDKVTIALALVSASQSDFSLFLSEGNGEIIPLVETSNNAVQVKTAEAVNKGKKDTQAQHIIFRTVNIEGNLKLIITSSIEYLYVEKRSEILRFSFYLLIAGTIALAVLLKVISQDVARESQALKLSERLKYEESRRKVLLEFASDTSHELRTPLTVIRGYLELFERHKSEKFEPAEVKAMGREASRLEKNIANLLTMLELEVIEDESLIPINLSTLVEDELLTFRAIERERNIIVNIEKGLWIKGSEELALKLIGNCLSNISRHSALDSPVSVDLRKAGGMAEISIEDGGPLENSKSMNIEDYLTRFSSSRSVTKGGSGLGFSIMKKSATKLSGEISIFRSRLGGFGVQIRIPLTNSFE